MTPGSVDLAAVLDGVRSSLDESVACVEGVARAVEAALAGLPHPAAGGVRAQVAELRQAVGGVHARFTAFTGVAGDPSGLRATGAAWITGVSAPVSRLVGVATPDVMRTDDSWTGVAADAYRAVLPAQQAALAAIAGAGHDVDAALTDLAAAITRFWIALATACLLMVVALGSALAAAGTVAGAPLAPAAALAGVGALVTAGNAALSGLTELTLVTTARTAALERRLTDHTAFPAGVWPRSTVGTDASVTDGDASDWEVR
jgi:hypothetical protein